MKALFGAALLVAAAALPAAAADTCILSSQKIEGMAGAAEAAKQKIDCVYACPGGKSASQTITLQQRECPKTMPPPK